MQNSHEQNLPFSNQSTSWTVPASPEAGSGHRKSHLRPSVDDLEPNVASCSSSAGPPSIGSSLCSSLSLGISLSLFDNISLSLFHSLPRSHSPDLPLSNPLSPSASPCPGEGKEKEQKKKERRESLPQSEPSLPRRKSVLATENHTSDHQLMTQNRTSPPTPPTLAHHRSDPLSVRLSLSASLFLSLTVSLSVSLSRPISPSRTHSLPLPHHVPVKGKKNNRRRKNREKGKIGRCKMDSVH
jgi:hypothetical protein